MPKKESSTAPNRVKQGQDAATPGAIPWSAAETPPAMTRWQWLARALRVSNASMVTGGWNSMTTVMSPVPSRVYKWPAKSMSPYQANSGRMWRIMGMPPSLL